MNPTLRDGLVPATRTLAGALASFVTMWLVCRAAHVGPQPAILAAVLALGFGRRPATASAAAFAFGSLRIAAVALAVSAIALLLRMEPFLGAVVFTACMALSVWLRDLGPTGRTAGTLIALPLVAMLVVPVAPPHAAGGPFVDLALVIGAGVVALSYVTLLAEVGPPRADGAADAFEPERLRRAGLTPTARMAMQMGAALALAFCLGLAAFPSHWGWVVLTAFIVCSGARGRGDAFYKALLRLIGALAGTVVAALVARAWAPAGIAEATTIFVLLFFGLWLRDLNYAYWAFATTSILALLVRSSGAIDVILLGERLEGILVGACCGVAATWFVFPIRTDAVARRRLADALLALDACVTHAHLGAAERSEKHRHFEHRIAKLAEVAPALHLHRRILARREANHPARWIELANGLRARADAFELSASIEAAAAGRIRRAIGTSRRAIADHGKPVEGATTIGAALERLHAAFDLEHTSTH